MNLLNTLFLIVAVVEAELDMVQVLFRHGDRAPSFSYPNDPHDESVWPRGFSQLTEKGVQEAMELGDYLNYRYSKLHPLIPKSIKKSEVYFRSSDKDRCIETAMSVSKTLFPDDLVPIHTYSTHKQDLLLKPNSVRCLQADNIVEKEKNVFYEQMNRQHKHFFNFLSHKTGMRVQMNNVKDVFNSVYRKYVNGLEQPSWVHQSLPDNQTVLDLIVELKRQDRMMSFNSFEKSKLRTGFLLGQLVHDNYEKVIGISKRKIGLYSTHDATLTSLLYSLGVSDDQLPSYTAAVMIELHKMEGQYFVKILYRNDKNTEPKVLRIPGCSTTCPFSSFQRLLEDSVVHSRPEFEALCANDSQVSSSFAVSNYLRKLSPMLINCLLLIKVSLVLVFYFTSISKEYLS